MEFSKVKTMIFHIYLHLYARIKGYNVCHSGDKIIVKTPFGKIAVNMEDIILLKVLREPLEDIVSCVDIKGSIIVDIGAYLGETALLFLSKGAEKVYALEPVGRHYDYLVENIARNNAEGKIVPLNYGAWFRDTIVNVGYMDDGTGLRTTGGKQVAMQMKDLCDILTTIYNKEGRINLVKMDCEGCEYSLLKLDNKIVSLAEQYIIETHGPETPILDKMVECGYDAKLIGRIGKWIAIYLFKQKLIDEEKEAE
ncbi:MAG: FkbM family methyltransferase [Candidatus Brockarchaeota archaeon]|nr:FkbM family methyltransferase [Candidatus Brockarchaeota archaeon]